MAKKSLADQLADLRDMRNSKAARQESIMTKAAEEGRSTDEAEAAEFDEIDDELTTIDKDIGRLEKMVKHLATNSTAIENPQRTDKVFAVAKQQEKLEPGIEFARYAMCLAAGRGNLMQSFEIAKSRYPQNERVVNTIKAAVEAGTTTDATWASPLVDYNNFAGDFIEFLRPQTIIGRIPNLRRVPFNIQIPAQTSGGAAYWTGEGAPKPLTSFDFSNINLRWAKVANIAVLTEELVRFSTPSAEALVRQSLADAIRERLDIDFVDPAKAAVANVSPASITNGATAVPSSGTDADAVRCDMQALFATFIAANNAPSTGVWIMPTTTALALSLMQNPLGQSEFPGVSMNGGTLFGLPVVVSDYVPFDSSGAIVILANASDILLADDGQVVIDASREASLQMLDNPTNNSATATATTMVSMFQTNSVAIRAERWINWARRRTASVAYLTGVNWGACVTP